MSEIKKEKVSKRRKFSAQDKQSILLKKFKHNEDISSICRDNDIQPSQFYNWQEFVFNGMEGLFVNAKKAGRPKKEPEIKSLEDKIKELESKLQRRETVIAELTEELVLEKKCSGALFKTNGSR